ncbi:hypothetical protein HYPSUDRAFT_44564 [Hypholoma sublateritium FD-334 SS-4]|uniref:CHAT domain-containing protein n=1 Tax=Hypholoma sublateritium (strain FD-334 SS-4) TaxID=945553 RepID=A0A0D2NJN8_HYPSF|nr:hypothetical protein HYPSUDRAFT_44564 [Hypholoma sublateritium FD-334 SS-4]
MPPQQQLIPGNGLPANRERSSDRAGGVVAVLSRAFNARGRQASQRIDESSSLPVRAPEAAPVAQTSSSFFAHAAGIDIQGGHFENYSGPSISVTNYINTGQSQEENSTAAHRAASSATVRSRDEYQDVEGHNEQSSYVRNNDNFAARPQILPIMRNCDIYYRHLSVKGRGSPLWLPAVNRRLPIEYRRKGISIGDVGLITFSGSFDFLFNILLPAEHPIHGGRVPERFIPLSPPLEPEDVEDQEEFAEDSYLASASVKRTQNDGRGDSSGLTFETTDSEGAILAIPKGSDSSNLLNLTRFSEYVDANIEDWYRYTNGKRGRQAKNGDLRLVTGWDKAKAWGMATFSRSSSTAQAPFQLDFKPLEQAGRSYKWEYSGIAEGRTGPSIRESTDLRLPDEPEDITFTNQCLFIRTINPLLSKNTWKRLEETKFTAVKTEDPGASDLNSNSEVSHLPNGKGKAVDSGPPVSGSGTLEVNSVIQSSDSATALSFHPSTAINEFLLSKNPEARIAITEDINWISVLAEDDYSLPPGDQILQRVMERHEIYEEKGIIYLRSQNTLNTLDHPALRVNEKCLRSRANVLMRGLDQAGHLDDLEEAILLYRQALELVSESGSDRQDISSELAEALLCRHQLFHQSSDYNEAIDLHMENPEFQYPSHSIKHPDIYSIMGNATVRTSYQERPDDIYPQPSLAGVEECILLQKMALELLPLSHPLRPKILDILAGILIYQYVSNAHSEILTNPDGYLDEAISLRRQALQLTSPSNPSHQGILLSLADALYFRHSRQFSGLLSDLDEAIQIHRKILDILPSSHPRQPTIVKCLAMELSCRYGKEKQLDDLNEAISLFKHYLYLPPPFRPDRPDILDALADALFELHSSPRGIVDEDILLDLGKASGRWYMERYNEDPIRACEKAILFQKQALELLSPMDHRRVDIIYDFMETSIIRRDIVLKGPPRFCDASESTPQQTELEHELGHTQGSSTDLLSLCRQTLELISPSHPGRFDILRSLSTVLVDLYDDDGELALLEEAILFQKQAVELRSPPHPDYFDMLSNLANTLARRYEQGGEITDLYNSISFNKQVFASCPSNYTPEMEFALLSNLAHGLACRFDAESQISDLDEAISLNRKAIEIPLPPSKIHPAFINLGNALSRRFEQRRQITDLNEAINLAELAISRLTPSDPEINQFYGSLRVALKLRSEFTDQTDNEQSPASPLEAISFHFAHNLAQSSSSQSDALDNPVTSSTGSRSVEGGDGVNLDKLSSHHQNDNKKPASRYLKEDRQKSGPNPNEKSTPSLPDLSAKEGRSTERRRRLSSSSIISNL